MDDSGEFEPAENSAQPHGRSRKRPKNACATCRARKVKCDERPNGCLNCERLQLNCVQQPSDGANAVVDQVDSRALTGIKRKRTFRVCIPCRQSKIKCSGERPVCSRCRQRMATCAYDAEAAEPAWVQTITPSNLQPVSGDLSTSSASPTPSRHTHMSLTTSIRPAVDYPPALSWLFAQDLPPKAKLQSLLEAFFTNIYSLRVFAFVHRPSFMRMLDEGLLIESSDQALLHIMCALGARFYVLDYSESTQRLPKELIQTAGSQWAKIAEELFFAEYSTISVTKLKVLVLLHDHEARSGNYAGSFLLTGLIIRMAHALQINMEYSTDILCKQDSSVSNEVSLRESRRRLMWACYMVDVWAGSGVDQLTILNERDIKLQLPCNERQFLLQIPTVTERLLPGEVLDFISPEDMPEKPSDNMGMSAYFVRIVHIWQKVLRYIKHLDEVEPPWIAGGEFENLIDSLNAWKQSHPTWMAFSSDNIYIRRASSQLGGLFLVHCMYHHVLCDLHRIALPNLFKIGETFEFPPDQYPFRGHLQATCFENAQKIAIITSQTLQHGVNYLADPILPSFVYNSSRIMLYYIARILDRTKPGATAIIDLTIGLVEKNNKALREMSQMYPLAEPLYVTTERWLDTVRGSSGHITGYLGPQDIPDPDGEEAPEPQLSSPSMTVESIHDRRLSALPDFGPMQQPSSETTATGNLNSSPINYPYATSNTYSYAIASSSEPLQLGSQPNMMSVVDPHVQAEQGGPYYPGIENLEQPMFDLNELQNFFEWENGEIVPPPTGLEGLGGLGWNNLSNMQ